MSNLIINKNVELRSGFEWIKLSFCTFREKPLQFITLSLINLVLGLLPLFGSFISPIFMARFASLANQVENNQEIRFSTLLNNLFTNKMVVRVAFLNFCFNAVLFIAQYLLNSVFQLKGFGNLESENLVLAILIIPLIFVQLAMWLAPVICLYNENMTPKEAMLLSIKAGIYNIPTLLLYSILIVAFTCLAIIPLGLGLFVWLPTLNLTNYYVYKNIYIKK